MIYHVTSKCQLQTALISRKKNVNAVFATHKDLKINAKGNIPLKEYANVIILRCLGHIAEIFSTHSEVTITTSEITL